MSGISNNRPECVLDSKKDRIKSYCHRKKWKLLQVLHCYRPWKVNNTWYGSGYEFQSRTRISRIWSDICLNHRYHFRDLSATKPPQKSIGNDSEYSLDTLYVVYNHFWTNCHGISLNIARSGLTVSIPRLTQTTDREGWVNRNRHWGSTRLAGWEKWWTIDIQ